MEKVFIKCKDGIIYQLNGVCRFKKDYGCCTHYFYDTGVNIIVKKQARIHSYEFPFLEFKRDIKIHYSEKRVKEECENLVSMGYKVYGFNC